MDTSTGTTRFAYFPKLPIELRLQIWSHAIVGRVVNIIYDPELDKFFSFNSSVPAILHACSESRKVGLEVETLKRSFGTRKNEAKILFDFARDTLFFDDWMSGASLITPYWEGYQSKQLEYPQGLMSHPEMHSIERLAINYRFVGRHPDDVRTTAARFRKNFPSMKTLVIVVDQSNVVENSTTSRSRATIQFIDTPIMGNCGKCKVCQEIDVIHEEIKKGIPTSVSENPAARIPDIKVVVADRGSHLSGSPCSLEPPGSGLGLDESEYESDSDSDPDSGSEFDSGSETAPELPNTEEDGDLEEGELTDLIEEEREFYKCVGYNAEYEDRWFWTGAEYIERRSEL